MLIVVASGNPVKSAAAADGWALLFPDTPARFESLSVPSGVADQPMGDEQTLAGATQRATSAQAIRPDADYVVGIEGGCAIRPDGDVEAFAHVVVLHGPRRAHARTATFVLPPAVAQLVKAGVELGVADDRVFGRHNSKQTNGAVGLLTGDAITRRAYYAHAVALALVPFRNQALYDAKNQTA